MQKQSRSQIWWGPERPGSGSSTAKLQDAIKLVQKELVEKHAKQDQERVEEIERMNEDPILRLIYLTRSTSLGNPLSLISIPDPSRGATPLYFSLPN